MSQYLEIDKDKTRATIPDMVKFLWPYMRKHWQLLVIFSVAVFASIALGRALPFIFGYAVDHGLQGKNLALVFNLAALYFSADILRVFFYFARNYWSQKLGNRVLFEVRSALIHHTQLLPMNYFDRNPAGRTVNRLTQDVLGLKDLFDHGVSVILVGTLELISIAIAMSLISVPITLAVLIFLPVFVLFGIYLSRKLRDIYALSKRKMAELSAFTAERLNGIKTVHLYNQGERSAERFQKLSLEYRTLQFQSIRQYAKLWPVLSFSNLFNVVIIFSLVLAFREKIQLQMGELTTFILLSVSFYGPVRQILDRYTEFQNSLTSTDRVLAMMQEPTESRPKASLLPQKINGKIEFKNVTFRYQNQVLPALHSIHLTLNPGESVGLVGRTGSGKTTLVSLIQKLYTGYEGEIRIDGLELESLEPRDLRSHMGVVLQDNYIFRGTLYSNISLGSEKISMEKAMWAAEKCSLMTLIQNSPDGLLKKVEEKGVNLSSGERQLLAFARVLAFNPDLLILDEATSNIDSQSELLIQNATQELMKNRTSLIIAHRLSTIVNCDRIVVLESGKILEEGSHGDLLKMGGKYAQLYSSHRLNHAPLGQPVTEG